MKSFLLIFLFMLSGIVVNAQISHDLEIYSDNGEKFFLTINGRKMNQEATTNIEITNTDKDYVNARIEFENPEIPSIEKKFLQIAEPGTQVSPPVSAVYKIVNKKGEYKLVFASRSRKKIQPNSDVIIINNAPSPSSNGRISVSW